MKTTDLCQPHHSRGAALVIWLVCAGAGCLGGCGDPWAMAPKSAEEIADARPAFSLTMADLAAEVKSNKSLCQTQYDGKIVEVSGFVDDIHTSGSGEGPPFVVLKRSENENLTAESVSLKVETAEAEPSSIVEYRQKVKFKGQMDFRVGMTLKNAILTYSSPRRKPAN